MNLLCYDTKMQRVSKPSNQSAFYQQYDTRATPPSFKDDKRGSGTGGEGSTPGSPRRGRKGRVLAVPGLGAWAGLMWTPL